MLSSTVSNIVWTFIYVYYSSSQRPQKVGEQRKKPRKVEPKAQKFQDMKHGVEFSDYADPAKLRAQSNSQPRPESLEVNQRRQENAHYDQKATRPPNGPQSQYSQDVSRHTNNENNNHFVQTGNHHPPSMHQNQFSPHNRVADNRGSSSSIGSNIMRPNQPPPAPPPHLANLPHHSPQRDSLPPPPPPPPLPEDEDPRRYQPSPEITRVPTTHRPSPARQEVDLLPPPPPPPLSPEQNLPPPPPPPPVHSGMAPPPPPPPPPPMSMTNGVDDNSSTGSGQSSSIGSAIMSSPKLKPTPKQPAVVDERSNLLAQIRLGTRKYFILVTVGSVGGHCWQSISFFCKTKKVVFLFWYMDNRKTDYLMLSYVLF